MTNKYDRKTIREIGTGANATIENFVKDCKIGSSAPNPHYWIRTENLIKFSSKLPEYLQKHHGISIYKLSDKSCAEIPLLNLDNISDSVILLLSIFSKY